MTDRNQTVLVGGRASQFTVLKYGVRQGSALGPVLFTIYITALGHVIRHYNSLYHLFAEDTQLHKYSSPEHFGKFAGHPILRRICEGPDGLYQAENE